MRYSLLILFATATTLVSFTRKGSLDVTSAAFTNNGVMPAKFSCEGSDVNPPLHVANIPGGAKSLALIMHDPDAPVKGGFTHWVIWNISPKGDIAENFKEAEQGLNGAGKTGYKGMCPPSGTHRYYFYVYALDTKLHLGKNTDKAMLEKAMQGHILSDGSLVGLYKKTK